MRLKREQFLTRLQQVSPGLATREILEQSASFVFKEGKIITFNDEILCVAEYDCGITGSVHAAPLMSLLGKMPDDEISIEAGQSELLVNGKSRAGVRMNKEVLLPTGSVEEAVEWYALHPDFNDALELVQGSASRDDLHFNLTCVHLTKNHIEACDGYQMTRCNLVSGLKQECLIKQDTIKRIVGLGMTQVSEGKSWIHFKANELRISCRRWEQEYLNLDSMIDFKGKKTTLPGGLAEAVEKAEIFSVDNASENQILVQIKQGKLRLRGEGAHGWYEERKKIDYDGDPISFHISPKLLSEITRRTNDCELTADRLKIDAGKFIFIACLGKTETSEGAPAAD